MEENNVVEQTTAQDKPLRRTVSLDKSPKVIPMIVMVLGMTIMLCQWVIGLNIVALVGAMYMCITSAIILIGLISKKKLYLWYFIGYVAVSFGIAMFFIVNGADAGWGAITSGQTGFDTATHGLWQGEGNFGTRLLGNIIICSPSFVVLLGLYLIVDKMKAGRSLKTILTYAMSVLLIGTSILYVFTMNLRSNPKVFDLSKGHDEYLNGVKKNANHNNPNVLVILMDDLGYGDTSYNARKGGQTPAFETPTLDWIAQSGVDFDNFYSSYSVCSPSRFAMMTGRYPYRGNADNVMYPTVNTFAPLATTRVFNSIELGANCDGMLGDEVTMAESFQQAGYETGCFGKWHLGDYGQYLPTKQGFDYFYGSHHVNDMVPFYHATEQDGEYKISVGTEKLNQNDATKIIHNETYNWIADKADNSEPFFAYYATPWPHAPLFASEEFQGSTGAGIYADCVTEFDHYLGELFAMMQDKGVLDDTIIVFSSDNGPALQGSMNELRGGKFSPYEGGQKVPFYMRWGNGGQNFGNKRGLDKTQPTDKGRTIAAPATLADLYPTLTDICNITNQDESIRGYMPSDVDREIDGVNMMPIINDTTGTKFIHDKAHPILHMKREKIHAVQYSLTQQELLDEVKDYKKEPNNKVADGKDYAEIPFIKDNSYTTWKYFKKYKNDNPEFFDKSRKNWLICLTDDRGESYQRAQVFPTIADDSKQVMNDWTKKFNDNRRGYYKDFYKK
ncbi:MAG: sulfatase-like hydrolase/transferase [Clostridia bacterium]